MPLWHFALSHASTASMHSILNLAFYRKCGKLPMVSHRFRRIPEQARAVAKSFFAAFGGREGGERIGGTAPGPPVKGLAALCNPACIRYARARHYWRLVQRDRGGHGDDDGRGDYVR